jgi:hypothetical protein
VVLACSARLLSFAPYSGLACELRASLRCRLRLLPPLALPPSSGARRNRTHRRPQPWRARARRTKS